MGSEVVLTCPQNERRREEAPPLPFFRSPPHSTTAKSDQVRRYNFVMTESDWAACCDPAPMLHFVRLRATPRQLRLFCCACCRLIWDALPGDWSRDAVELGELF